MNLKELAYMYKDVRKEAIRTFFLEQVGVASLSLHQEISVKLNGYSLNKYYGEYILLIAFTYRDITCMLRYDENGNIRYLYMDEPYTTFGLMHEAIMSDSSVKQMAF